MGIKSDAIRMADRKELASTSDFSGDPYAHLAAAIIIKAFEDLKRLEGEEKTILMEAQLRKMICLISFAQNGVAACSAFKTLFAKATLCKPH